MTDKTLVRVRDLTIRAADRPEPLVDGVSLQVRAGESLGIVGESGSGKSLTCRAILGILPATLTAGAAELSFDDVDLRTADTRRWRSLRGTRIGAVFQDPASYLNPSLTVGRQVAEVLRVKRAVPRGRARAETVAQLDRFGLREPAWVFDRYPHELSGGMLQRVLIAIAVAEEPELLIADEPTTALDATVQAEVLDIIAGLREETGLSLLFVSHDLAVVAQVCDRVAVMRAGRIVEEGVTADVLAAPQHPYTHSLVESHREYGLEKHRPADRWTEELHRV